MRKFKFFQKPVKGDLTMLDGLLRTSSSYTMYRPGRLGTTGSPGIGMYGTIDAENAIDIPPLHEWDTPQGHNGRRRLYHTNPEEYERQRREREELRWRFRSGNLNDEDRNRFDRLRSTNDDMERYFIENGFRDFNDNRVEPPVTKPKLKWYQRFLNEDNKLILLVLSFLGGIGIFITAFVYYYTQR